MFPVRPVVVLSLTLALFSHATGQFAAQVDSSGRAADDADFKAGRNYFGLLGQVSRPGVYEIPMPFPYLVDVVRQAGGLTDAASGHLWIVRRGPVGYQSFYATHLETQLQPGDVVVANRKPQVLVIPERESAPEPAPGSIVKTKDEPKSPAFVQLSFVNLVERPVVVKMKRQDATVAGVVARLGQTLEVIDTVRLIPSEESRGAASDPQKLLASGSVLIFDSAVIQAERIPPLPPVRTDATTIKQNRVPPPHARPGEKPAKKKVVYDGGEIRQTTESVSPQVPSDSAQESRLTAGRETVTVSEAEPERTPVFTPAAALNSLAEKNQTETKSARIPSTKISTTTPAPAGDPFAQPQIDTAADSPILRNRDGSSIGWLTIFLTTFLVLAGWQVLQMIWSLAHQKRTLQMAAGPAAQIPQSIEEPFDELINDELPVAEEPVRFPQSLQFYGHPTGSTKLRIDAAHQTPRPHFHSGLPATAGNQSAGQTTADTVSDRSSNQTESNQTDRPVEPSQAPESPSNPARSTGSQAGLLDRVLSTVHGATPE